MRGRRTGAAARHRALALSAQAPDYSEDVARHTPGDHRREALGETLRIPEPFDFDLITSDLLPY
ncbi:hypothetical protein [Kitasatospora sp. NPDC057500]|uniref:hypothetical protein n=1 Tax=Kitasatospora sp. NPDC057500 TaxID=3346151 RepID=UPI0036C2A4A2